ncbi:hypothetical protein AYI68_g1478 [Smittium mucronatum]|uniref:Uncharacterized protein n=1 Tax=Smittium mucronatum TaxID=133383 RepID=A0A1R0H5A0_9FUNG|nr:hypothetical protein AYI68_g1478 [Smittium mucronatum]
MLSRLASKKFLRVPKTLATTRFKSSLSAFPDKPTWSVNSLVPHQDLVLDHLNHDQIRTLLFHSALENGHNSGTNQFVNQLLYFINHIQHVDTTDISPLCSLTIPYSMPLPSSLPRDADPEAQAPSNLLDKSKLHQNYFLY